jgi:hypothetical protein
MTGEGGPDRSSPAYHHRIILLRMAEIKYFAFEGVTVRREKA